MNDESNSNDKVQVESGLDTFHVPAFELPTSYFLDKKTRAALSDCASKVGDYEKHIGQWMAQLDSTPISEIPAIRQREVDLFYQTQVYADMSNAYLVNVETEIIAGIPVELFTPEGEESTKNQGRILINLHGGCFTCGSRTNSKLESMPVASVGQIKVVSVDYRLAPEHCYPAAVEDVLSVYQSLLKRFPASCIGLYGCSAGGSLVSQTVARLNREGIPLPAAIGMFFGSASRWEGDAMHIGGKLSEWDVLQFMETHPYYKGADMDDGLVTPGACAEELANFPPSLLISSTRDFALSAVVHTHSQLIKLGVDADLHLWEGLNHAFFYNPDIPESQDAYRVISNFFDQRLDSPE